MPTRSAIKRKLEEKDFFVAMDACREMCAIDLMVSSLTNLPKSRMVFKIAGRDEWRCAVAAGHYDGSADDKRDGFIHLSAASQVAGTLERYFKGRDGLLLIAFDSAMLEPQLKWEVSRAGALFPHYYGRLPTALACWQKPIGSGACDIAAIMKDMA